ncbi:phage tail tape measure protein [Stenotrophomonas sp. GZD-301]|uniref:phage tail tape measure protein n=1 Tax=Stenotrophomonas sp. GZD-301 TaxID=3404814 RepID=UPI003BB80A4A
MAEPSANLRVRISADLADIRQGLGLLTRQLREVRSEAARPIPAKNGINALGVSAGQTAQAMQQLPAQFTDVITSIQGGMPWFTVLLQQGGQIKDSFGGIEPALKGVSAALLGMVNPYTIAAAAVGLVVYAWYDAEKQAEAYTRALVLSRNEAAATSLTLVTLAQRTSEAMGVTAGVGEDAAKAIGDNGRIAAQNMQAVAAAAVAMKEVTGQAIDDTVALYGKLAQDPVKNAQKLNEQVNFMTVALYEQVKALQDQGRNQDAATVITRAAADETVMALARVRASQNPVVRGFKDIFVEASKAWAVMQNNMGFGPEAAQMQKMLADNRRDVARLNALAASDDLTARNPMVISAIERDVKARSAKIKAIAADLIKERKDAEVKAAQQASAEFVAEMDTILSAQASKEEKKRKEVEQANGQAAAARRRAQAAGLLGEVKVIEERRAAAVAAIEKKYEQKPTAGTGTASRSAGLQGYKDDLVAEQAQITAGTQLLRAQLSAREITAAEYYSRMRTFVQQGTDAQASSLEQQIAFLQKQAVTGKDAINVNRQIGELEARLAKLRIEGAAALQVLTTEESAAANTRANVITAYASALDASNEALKRQLSTQVQRVGMGDREYEIQQKLSEAYADQAEKLRELTLQRNAGQIDQSTFDEEKVILLAKTLDRLQAVRDGYGELQAAESNWLLGAVGAWENYRQAASNAAQQMGSVVGSVFSGFEEAWATFTTNGKLSFSDMTKSVLADLAKIQYRQAVMGFAKSFGGEYTGTIGSLFSGSWGFSSGGYTGDGGKFEPAGVVHKGEVVWSQADIARAGGVGIVEAMRKGLRGYTDGGAVATRADPTVQAGSITLQSNLTFKGGTEGGEQPAVSAHLVKESFNSAINDWAMRNLRPGGVLYQAGYRR